MTALSRIKAMQSATRQAASGADTIRHIVIVGGGSAGWMSAAALSNVLGANCRITLVESELIGTVGVGEATIPSIRLLNHTMGVNEQDFLRDTQGTFKLGIEFVNWGREGHRYFHPFGFLGMPFDALPVHQHWLKHRQQSDSGTLDEYSLAWHAAKHGRFSLPTLNPQLLTSTFNYAFHFDASLYAQHLRKLSVDRGVRRIEGKITRVHQHNETGHVTSVELDSGEQIAGDFYIDCSGFSSLLLGETLKVGYESWNKWLPCDTAVAMPCTLVDAPVPFTRSTALSAGWQWTIPLRHRVGNGYVFSSSFTTEDFASEELQSRLPGQALGSPRLLKFTAGRRQKAWEHNVLALGLASGFLEPLESTSLHLVHSGIATLLSLFPDKHCHAALRNEYNRRFANEMERIRDFLILHYKLTQRQDSEMWRYCADMRVPDSLEERMQLFKHGGHVQTDNYDLFGAESWLAVHLGQLNFPDQHTPLLDMRQTDARPELARMKHALAQTALAMPRHEDFLNRYLNLHT
jgi:tryptophan halogenase